MISLCESCALMREVISGTGSRFLLCTLAACDRLFQKYPQQPVVRCEGYVSKVADSIQADPNTLGREADDL